MASLKSLLAQQIRQVASAARSQSSTPRTSAASKPAPSADRATSQLRYTTGTTPRPGYAFMPAPAPGYSFMPAPAAKKPYEGYVAPTAPSPKVDVPGRKSDTGDGKPEKKNYPSYNTVIPNDEELSLKSRVFLKESRERHAANPSRLGLEGVHLARGVERIERERSEREKKEAALKEASDPNLDWLGVHAYTAKPIFEEMSEEDYANLDAAQRAAVDFNGALAAALEADRASGKFENQLLDAARSGKWDSVQAPMIQSLKEDLQLSGQGTDLKDFLSGRAGIAASSLEGLSEVKPSRFALERYGDGEEDSSKEGGIKNVLRGSVEDLLGRASTATTDPVEARRNRDAALTNMIRQRMSSILRENRREGGERLSLNEDQEKTFDDIYSIVTGYEKDASGGFKIDRDGLPQGIQINPGDVAQTLYDSGLGNLSDEFYRYVDIRIREELNNEDTEESRRKYLSLHGPGLLQKVGEG